MRMHTGLVVFDKLKIFSVFSGTPCKYTTPLHGLGALVPTVFHPGCDDIHCKKVQVDDAKKVASEASAVVLVMGSNQAIEREALDRADLMLPGQQQVLVSAVASVSKGPVILVIMSGGGIDVQFARDDPKVTSILWVGFPGQAGGAAIADVIVGHYNPSKANASHAHALIRTLLTSMK